jgi:hypothetical protein
MDLVEERCAVAEDNDTLCLAAAESYRHRQVCMQYQHGISSPIVVLRQAARAVAPSPHVNVPSGQARHTLTAVAAPPRDQKPGLHTSHKGPPKPGLQPAMRSSSSSSNSRSFNVTFEFVQCFAKWSAAEQAAEFITKTELLPIRRCRVGVIQSALLAAAAAAAAAAASAAAAAAP